MAGKSWKNNRALCTIMCLPMISPFTPEHHLTLVGGQEFIEYKTDYLRSGARQFEKVNFGLADMSLGASPDKVVTRLESDKCYLIYACKL